MQLGVAIAAHGRAHIYIARKMLQEVVEAWHTEMDANRPSGSWPPRGITSLLAVGRHHRVLGGYISDAHPPLGRARRPLAAPR